jgi:prepilin-type N-terminal cleavage/methylation domain-containing protein/prepilin-type processing-associated H-X9-DG protein
MAANSHNKNKHYQSGFTLVELLVVIAIISVLAGMLLPALSMSLEAARGIVCKNNLKSLNFSLTTYADDYDGWTLGTYYHYFGKSVKWPWLRVLCEEGYISEPYKGGTPEGGSVFYCPSQSDGEITPGLPATHYGINRTLCTVGRDMKSRGIKSWTSVTLGLVKIYSINPPSEIMSFADSQMDSYGVSYYTPASYPNFRHHEIMTNFSFIDGHVESAEQSDVFLNADRWVIPGYPWYFSSY